MLILQQLIKSLFNLQEEETDQIKEETGDQVDEETEENVDVSTEISEPSGMNDSNNGDHDDEEKQENLFCDSCGFLNEHDKNCAKLICEIYVPIEISESKGMNDSKNGDKDPLALIEPDCIENSTAIEDGYHVEPVIQLDESTSDEHKSRDLHLQPLILVKKNVMSTTIGKKLKKSYIAGCDCNPTCNSQCICKSMSAECDGMFCPCSIDCENKCIQNVKNVPIGQFEPPRS